MPTSPVVIFCLVDDQIEGNPECLEAELVSFFCALMERARRKVREISHATSPMQLLGRLKTLNKATTTTTTIALPPPAKVHYIVGATRKQWKFTYFLFFFFISKKQI
jgi:hypothetical protein